MIKPTRYPDLVKFFNFLTLLGSILLLVSLSYDVVVSGRYDITGGLLHLQLVICAVFMADYFVELYSSYDRRKFAATHFVLLLVSIPYLNIVRWVGAEPSQSVYIILKSMPLVRGFYAIYVMIRWITRSRLKGLLISYVFSTLAFSYFAALIFYSYESGVNKGVDNFGDCLWWAGMNVTTVGADLFAVTAIGKVLSVVLPALGMMMFPIFTVYVTNLFQKSRPADVVHGKGEA